MATPGAESAVYDCLVIVRSHVKTDAAYCYNCFVAWFVCLLVTTKTDEQMEMPFRLWTRLGPENHVLGADPDSCTGKDTFGIILGHPRPTLSTLFSRWQHAVDVINIMCNTAARVRTQTITTTTAPV